MHNLFTTKKAIKSLQGHTCCQLFVTNKGLVYVVPMTSKGDVIQSVKQFSMQIGAPEVIICDTEDEKTSNYIN